MGGLLPRASGCVPLHSALLLEDGARLQKLLLAQPVLAREAGPVRGGRPLHCCTALLRAWHQQGETGGESSGRARDPGRAGECALSFVSVG